MTRIVNFRPLFYLFLAFALGIAFAYYIFSINILIIVITSCIVLALTIFSLYRHKWKQLLSVLIAFVVGIGGFFIDYNSFSSTEYNGKNVQVVGRIGQDFRVYDNYIMAVLTNVRIDGKAEKNLQLSISNFSGSVIVSAGDTLSFSAEVYNNFMLENGQFNSFDYKNDAPYFANIESDSFLISHGNLTLAEGLRSHIQDILNNNMREDIATLAYSVLFGDKISLDSEIKDNFQTVGLAHLLAVSGLHIGFLVAVLYWLLKKLKCVGLPRFIIVAVFLLFYSYLCDFTPSVVRASLMCLTFLAIGLFGRQYDLLSSIGLAGIIILIFNPLYVFDAGFLMSFFSVLAIAVLCKPFSRILQKIKFPEKIADAISLDLMTTLAIVPIIAIFFGKISLLSWIANLFCIPIFAFAFSVLLVLTFFVCIFNFLGFLLVIPQLLFTVIIWFAGVVASATWAIIPLYTLTIVGAILFYFILFIYSPFVMTDIFKKSVCVCVALVVGVVSLFAFNSPEIPKENTYTQLNTWRASAVVTSASGQILVVGNVEKDLEYIESYLKYKKYNHINVFVPTSSTTTQFTQFAKKYNVDNIIRFTNTTNFGDFNLKIIYKNSIMKVVYVNVQNVGVLLEIDKAGTNQASEIATALYGLPINAIYLYNSNSALNNEINCQNIFSREKVSLTQGTNYSTLIHSSFTFSFNNGIMGNIRSVNLWT